MEPAIKLNYMQLFMLKMFKKQLADKQEKEIKELLSKYFVKQIDEEMRAIWDKRGLSQKDLDEDLNTHKHTNRHYS